MKKLLDQDKYSSYREYLYPRGYLITDSDNINLDEYPFYKNWSALSLYNYKIYLHFKQKCYLYENNDKKFFSVSMFSSR